MAQAVVDFQTLAERELSPQAQLPVLPSWAVPRRRSAALLERAVLGPRTVVTGPTGSGKSMAVASWAATADLPGPLVWLSLAGPGADPHCFWELLRTGLVEAGEWNLGPALDTGAAERLRFPALVELAATLRRSGPWVVVLDDFPHGRAGRLGRELDVVLEHARGALRVVLISQHDPAIELRRHEVAGGVSRVGAHDLLMESNEVAEVLRRHGVEAGEVAVRTVEQHTEGWPCGVHLAAAAMRVEPTIEAAMEQAERASDEYLAAEMLDKTPPRLRELLVRTSVVGDVSPGLATAILGAPAVGLDAALASDGLIEVRPDRSFRCHPLLRSAALGQLGLELPDVARQSRTSAARWYASSGDVGAGIALALEAEDWPWVARTLVESYAVPRILAGHAGETVEAASRIAPVVAAEPLLVAARALRHGDADAAEVALQRVGKRSKAGDATGADRLSAAFIHFGVARLRGRAVEAEAVAEARALVSDLPDEEHDELSSLLDVCVAATELLRGSVDEAAATLRRHVQRSVGGPASRAARTDCAGQLALIEAFRGNLRVSERLVDSVLHGPGDESGPGALHAHLASAWIHLERVEPAPARQQLDLVADAAGLEPWLVVARQVAEARLLALSGQPEVAVRVAVPALKAAQARYQSGWLVDLLSLAAAEALLAAGEPRRALDLVTPYPGSTAVLATVLAAQARIGLGDAAGARADLGSVTDDLACAPLDFQIEAWLLEASIAQAGDEERARLLVDRALRTAAVESLRRPFTQQSEWLGTLLDRDAALRRAHSGFLAGLRPQAFLPARRSAVSVGSETLVVETLTVREAQVLELLAEMCSTDEIAGELFLSVNTVKTYVRGILRKLGVNRRVDAVRKGRELGLC